MERTHMVLFLLILAAVCVGMLALNLRWVLF
jgi:hypothetical protein